MRLRTQRGVKREGGNRVFNGYLRQFALLKTR